MLVVLFLAFSAIQVNNLRTFGAGYSKAAPVIDASYNTRSPMEPCACCGYKTIREKGCYEICPICYWEDDSVQEADPWFSGGANKPSLYKAQMNFKVYGAMEQRFQRHVRKPTEKDIQESTWRPLNETDKSFCTTPAEIESNLGKSTLASYNYWQRNA